MSLKPWREIAVPHEDVLKGRSNRLSSRPTSRGFIRASPTPEYQDAGAVLPADLHYRGHAPAARLGRQAPIGQGRRPGDPAADGLRWGQDPYAAWRSTTWPRVSCRRASCRASRAILDAAQITELPMARVAVLDGIELPDQPASACARQDRPNAVGRAGLAVGRAEGYARWPMPTRRARAGKAVLADCWRHARRA